MSAEVSNDSIEKTSFYSLLTLGGNSLPFLESAEENRISSPTPRPHPLKTEVVSKAKNNSLCFFLPTFLKLLCIIPMYACLYEFSAH